MHEPALMAATLAMALTAAGGQDLVTVTPREIDDVLANPHVGWQTFHRAADADRNLPAWIPSTSYYLRWGWKDVEPRAGAIDTALIDGTLAAAKQAGQTLAFRVMCCSSTPRGPYQPAWLTAAGGRVVETKYGDTPLTVPDFTDSRTLELHLDLIRRLGARYDGHPDLDHVDLGSLGWWGEWHMSGGGPVKMPPPEICRRVVDTYLQSFRRTPLVMLVGGREQLTYACQQGAGWRADCLGDLGGFSQSWCHMRKGYPEYYRNGQLQEVWKTAPVAYESCWDMRKWVAEQWSLRYIFNYALATHASYLNNKSAPLPDSAEVRPEVERFLARLGYRYVLREVRHPTAAAAGGHLAVASRWQNVGSAPCYRPYVVAWRLRAGDRTVLLPTTTAVRSWLPGEVEVFTEAFLDSPPDLPGGPEQTLRDTLPLPADLPPGEYHLAAAIVDPATGEPVLRLAIEGREADGWYPVSRLQITGQ